MKQSRTGSLRDLSPLTPQEEGLGQIRRRLVSTSAGQRCASPATKEVPPPHRATRSGGVTTTWFAHRKVLLITVDRLAFPATR
jgi:hypothetical protein